MLGDALYAQSQAFLAWAASNDEGDLTIRSRRRHDQGLSTLPCLVIRREGEYTIEEHVEVLMGEIRPSGT